MNRFSQFNIKITNKGFEGTKIKVAKILNREIIVHAFKIEDSKILAFKEKGAAKCLHIQISSESEMHIIFTSSVGLMEMIQQVPENKFPFTTTIIEDNDRYKFT